MQELSFDEVEELGLDGTMRTFVSPAQLAVALQGLTSAALPGARYSHRPVSNARLVTYQTEIHTGQVFRITVEEVSY